MTTTPTKNESLPELPYELEMMLARVYADAYQAGHDATVDGGFIDLHPNDRDTYWLEHLRQHEDVLHYAPALTREAPTEGVVSNDTLCMDWLERHLVEVREPLRYGSAHMFYALQVNDEGEPYRSDLRQRVLGYAMTATPSAPQRLAQGDCQDCGKAPTFTLLCEKHTTQPPHHDRGEVEQRARELLAEAYRRNKMGDELAESVERGSYVSVSQEAAIEAIIEALESGDGILEAYASGVNDACAGKIPGRAAALTEAKQQGPGEAVATIKLQSKERTMDRQPTVKCDDCGSDNDFCVYDGPSGLLSCTACGQMKQLPIATPQVEAKRQTGGDA